MVAACAPAPQSTNTKSQGSLRRRWSSSMRREGSGCEAAEVAVRARDQAEVRDRRLDHAGRAGPRRGPRRSRRGWRAAPARRARCAGSRPRRRCRPRSRARRRARGSPPGSPPGMSCPTPPLPPPSAIRRGALSGGEAAVARSLGSLLRRAPRSSRTRPTTLQERPPFLVAHTRPHQVRERRPARALGLPEQLQVGLPGRAAALPAIAVHAAGHDVLPRAAAAERARHHVVEIQLGAVRPPAAVLALEAVARHQVDAG